MNKGLVIIGLVGVIGLFLVFGPLRINVSGVDSAKINAATEVLSRAIENPEGRIPESVLEQAAAIAVVPDIFHESILYERGYGDGILIVRTEEGTWSNPSFVKFLQNSKTKDKLQSDDAILVFRDRKSIELFRQGRLVLGKDIATAEGPVANHAEKAAGERDQVGVYSYGMTEGRLTGIVIDQAVVQVNDWANKDFYSSRGVTFDMLLAKVEPKAVPVAANRFTCVVARYGNAGQVC